MTKKSNEKYRKIFLCLSKGCIKAVAFILLVCVALSTLLEAKGISSVRRHAVVTKQKIMRAPVVRKKAETIVPRKQSQRVSVIRKQFHTKTIRVKPSRPVAVKNRSSRAIINRQPLQIAAAKGNQLQAVSSRRNLQTGATPTKEPQPKTTATQKVRQWQVISARKSSMRKVPIRNRSIPPMTTMQKRPQNSLQSKFSSPIKASFSPRQSANIGLPLSKHPVQQKANHAQLPIVPVRHPINYLSLLKPHTQRNAKLGGLDTLYSKNLFNVRRSLRLNILVNGRSKRCYP